MSALYAPDPAEVVRGPSRPNLEAVAGLALATLEKRYRVQIGADAQNSECQRGYNHYSTSFAVAPQADMTVKNAWVTRAIDELVDMIGGETRHGLLVIRKGGVVVEDTTAGAVNAPIWRFRLVAQVHGSSYEEWQAMLRKLREEKL